MNDLTTTRWWWIRHAPVVDAKLGRLSGQADVDADVSDINSFARLALHLPKDALWVVSTLKRTQQTAQAVWKAGAIRTDAQPEADFVEQDFGDWTQKTWDEVGFGGAAEAFWKDPAQARPPGEPSESFADVCCRVALKIERLTHKNLGRDIICVAHAGSIRAAVAMALGLTPDQALALDVHNTSLTRLEFVSSRTKVHGDNHWRVVGLNQCWS
ncbi:MAG: histidine phosphatase family protein [Magnetovibrio sp.]|nr:histidine phosphatase family protein [Magnetovibrio sp.]